MGEALLPAVRAVAVGEEQARLVTSFLTRLAGVEEVHPLVLLSVVDQLCEELGYKWEGGELLELVREGEELLGLEREGFIIQSI